VIRIWVISLALTACSANEEEKARSAAAEATEKAKAAGAIAKEKAADALDRAKEAASVAKDKLGDVVEAGDAAFDRLVRKPGILAETDAAIQRATDAVKTATSEAARKAALTTLETVTKARAAIAKRIDELKAAGTF
jgi:hypothetical protein